MITSLILRVASTTFEFGKRSLILKAVRFSHPQQICTLAASDMLRKMMAATPEDLSILYEDSCIILVDKAANILCVPGKGAKPFLKFRHEEWCDAIQNASEGTFLEAEADCRRHILHLATLSSVPRKEARFYDFVSKVLKIEDSRLLNSIWNRIYETDRLLHKQSFEEIPNHLVSTADLVEKHCGHKIYTVHRLDMETSGVIIFAKTEASCAELARQFRDREVSDVHFTAG